MKRCPECRRDYYDDTLLYCLDDGNVLLEGPARRADTPVRQSSDEPQTAILHSTPAPGEAPTRAQIHTTEQTAVLPRGSEAKPRESLGGLSEKQSFSANRVAKPLIATVVAVAVLVGGFFGYRYFSPAKQIESIAVMPFVNESGNADVEYLSDGMAETLINSLSKLANLSVKARNAVFPYKGKEVSAKQIGEELGVQAVLLGRLAERGGNIKLNLELVNAKTLDVIWSEQYDRKQGDLVNLQQEIARDVSSRLRPRLSGTDEQKLAKSFTADSEAYRLYLQGRFYWYKQTGQEFEKCVDYFRRAIEKDPNFALGYVGLADYYGGREPDKAKENVNRALALDPDLAEANGTLGYQYMLDYDWSNAERYMKRALELDDNNLELHRWNGQRLMMLGRFDEAFAAYGRALEIDPNSSATRLSYGACLMVSGKLDEAVRYLEDAVKADPTHIWLHPALAQAYSWKNDWARSVERRAITREMSGDPEDARMMRESFAKGGRDGFFRDRIKLRESRNTPSGQSQAAEVYAWVGENEKALQILEGAAARKGDFWLFMIKNHPAYDPLRGDPRFQALVKIFDAPK
ncbi:MAG: tetratricopeptide repeat protein [Pyrinomonadaceae bacterium]